LAAFSPSGYLTDTQLSRLKRIPQGGYAFNAGQLEYDCRSQKRPKCPSLEDTTLEA